jgi:hypothetical protein
MAHPEPLLRRIEARHADAATARGQRFGVLFAVRRGGPGDDQSAVTTAPERHEVVAFDQYIQPDPVAIELLHLGEVGGGEHDVEFVLCELSASFDGLLGHERGSWRLRGLASRVPSAPRRRPNR